MVLFYCCCCCYDKVSYHGPAAAGRWACVPLRLPSLEQCGPAGQPCSPPPRDSVTTAPPDSRSTETHTLSTFTAGIRIISWPWACTCQWPRLTALKSGATPRLLFCSTAAPCSSNSLHTDNRPPPDAAVRAEGHTE